MSFTVTVLKLVSFNASRLVRQ